MIVFSFCFVPGFFLDQEQEHKAKEKKNFKLAVDFAKDLMQKHPALVHATTAKGTTSLHLAHNLNNIHMRGVLLEGYIEVIALTKKLQKHKIEQ